MKGALRNVGICGGSFAVAAFVAPIAEAHVHLLAPGHAAGAVWFLCGSWYTWLAS